MSKFTKMNKELYYGHDYSRVVEELLDNNSLQAIIVFVIDNMKFVNRTLDLSTKDKIMEKMHCFLHNIFGDKIIVGQTGSNEVSLFLTDIKSKEEVIDGIDDFISYAKQGIKIEDTVMRLGITCGIVFTDINESNKKESFDELFEDAQIAMQSALEDDFSSYMIFNRDMALRIERALTVVSELWENINESKFILKFQPLFDVSRGILIGFEVLSRICSDKCGIISPTEFVGLAEKNNLLCDLDRVIFDLACKDIKKVVDMGITNIKFSINVTPMYILKPGFIDDVRKTMQKYNMESRFIAFEITENTVFSSLDDIRRVVGQLNDLGISVYLDDFGSGFSNFVILQELKFARLKLDKTLIDNIGTARNNILVKKILEITEELGIKSVAEGIERKEQLEELEKLRCDIGQGYYFGKPMPFKEMLSYIEECKTNGCLYNGELVLAN